MYITENFGKYMSQVLNHLCISIYDQATGSEKIKLSFPLRLNSLGRTKNRFAF